MGERAGTRSSSRAVLRQPAGPWQVFLLTSLAWLLIAVIVLRFAFASAAAAGALAGVAVLLCASGESLITSANSGLPPRRRLAGYALAAVPAPVLTLLAGLRGRLSLTTDALTFLVTVIAVALAGGLAPSALESIAGSLLFGFCLIVPVHNSAITAVSNPAALGVFAAVALMVSILVGNAVRHGEQAARAIAESELLAAAAASLLYGQESLAALLDQAREASGMESVTLRTPLAAAKAAVSCLRSGDIQLTAADQDELLATAEESLDLLTNLVASLLDVSRLQAGALPVFPRPADLKEIIARALNGIGPQAEAVMVDVPGELPQVMVDPPIMERVIANVTANALRYSPRGSPPLLTASARGDRIELRVVDRGPGVAQAGCSRPSSGSATPAPPPVSGSGSRCPAA
jgi:two-component system sensor histidine kinase KdpD